MLEDTASMNGYIGEYQILHDRCCWASHDTSVAQDPLGASSAKALLSLAFGDRFKRVPWSLDDRIPGRAVWQTAGNAPPVPLKLWPVPASEVLNLESTEAMREITLLDATGRVCGRWAEQAAGLVHLGLQGLPSGVYVLRVDLADRTEHRSFTKGN